MVYPYKSYHAIPPAKPTNDFRRNDIRRRLCFTRHIGNSSFNGIAIIYFIIILIRVTFLQADRYRKFSVLIGRHFTEAICTDSANRQRLYVERITLYFTGRS